MQYEYNDLNYTLAGTKSYLWDMTSNTWLVTWQKDYYYSGQYMTEIEKDEATKSVVYPNPASVQIQIAFSKDNPGLSVELFDIQRQSLLKTELAKNQKPSIKSFPAGIYAYNIYFPGSVQSGRFVKK